MTLASPVSTESGSTEPLLELRNVSKAFGGVQALDRVNFTVLPGEIHALVGENGAGKSTLVKILAGAYVPDSGEVIVSGESHATLTPQRARAAGIAVVHQEFNLLSELTVAENVFLGMLPKGRLGAVSPEKAARLTTAILARLGSDLDPRRYVLQLSVVEQQLVEIAKALAGNARCIVMDEPSTVLSPEELKVLYAVLHRLRDEGRSIVYISHRLSEVFALSDRVTVFKDGRFVSSDNTVEMTEDELIRRMVGRPISELFPERVPSIGEPVLEVRNLTVPGKLFDVSVTVRRGEIVGLAGLGGSGRTTLARAVVGLEDVAAGQILLEGTRVPRSPGPCARAGVVMVPEDRKAHGIVAGRSVAANLSLPSLRRFSRAGVLSFKREQSMAARLIAQFGVRPASTRVSIHNLSGGNQQKVVLAKWFDTSPKAVVLDEPTRGVDVGAKSEIYAIIEDLSARGVGVLLASSDLTELLGVCDRIVVLREGRVAAELNRSDASEESILRAAVASGTSDEPEIAPQAPQSRTEKQ
ncbi:MAG: sugar transporter ATP-binding protein [Naasia sp.]|nr:sugar transporter ATP-binding protein [Naasia sp.]